MWFNAKKKPIQIKLEDGLEFLDKKMKKAFTIKKYNYYGDGNLIWCAFTGKLIYPLRELDLSEYYPVVITNGLKMVIVCDREYID